MRTKRYYVYILASKSRAIYVGMTGFLISRILQHKAGEGGMFTSKYHINRLVYYEVFEDVGVAIRRETEIKKWRREKKVALIEQQSNLGRPNGGLGPESADALRPGANDLLLTFLP